MKTTYDLMADKMAVTVATYDDATAPFSVVTFDDAGQSLHLVIDKHVFDTLRRLMDNPGHMEVAERNSEPWKTHKGAG